MRRIFIYAMMIGLLMCPAVASAEQLSDETGMSRWAYAVNNAPIRTMPTSSAPATGRLRFFTEDRRPEVYLLLQREVTAHGVEWIKLRIPRRPNGSTGWVRRDHLGSFHRNGMSLLVNRKRFRITLYKQGRVIFRARIGVGKAASPTPAGRFYIRERLNNLAGNPVYGPLAFGTSAYSRLSDWPGGGIIGIHGTDQPGILPGRVSHGCIRLSNSDIRQLARLLKIGTPLRII